MSLVQSVKTLKVLNNKHVAKGLFTVKKYSPEILTTVGIAGMVGTVILAARATLKLEDIVEWAEANKRILDAREITEEYTERDRLKDYAHLYIHILLELSKLYGPSVILGVSSIASILGAHGIMRRRNVALLAVVKTLETSFNEYRKRVIEEFGEEKDRDFRLGLRDEEVVDEETGKKTTRKVRDPNTHSRYSRFFDDQSSVWTKDAVYNQFIVTQAQNYFNDLLKVQGFVFLSDVYVKLGFPQTEESRIVGWLMGGDGDNYIDFGVYNIDDDRKRAFVNNNERSILLDFNVDGVISDKI